MKTTDGICDRSNWPNGPWSYEPEDKVEWEAHGLACMLHRGHSGAWCGYVDIPTDHHAFKVEACEIDVHGGITFDRETSTRQRRLGFDCNHWGDLAPGGLLFVEGTYCTRTYAQESTERMAAQLAGEVSR